MGVGEYNTCFQGCEYCYATKNPKTAQRNYKLHNPYSSLLIGEVNDGDVVKEIREPSYIDYQQKLF